MVRLLRGRLAVPRQDFSFPSPFNESHAVPNGLPKNLDVTVQKKTRLHLQDTAETFSDDRAESIKREVALFSINKAIYMHQHCQRRHDG